MSESVCTTQLYFYFDVTRWLYYLFFHKQKNIIRVTLALLIFSLREKKSQFTGLNFLICCCFLKKDNMPKSKPRSQCFMMSRNSFQTHNFINFFKCWLRQNTNLRHFLNLTLFAQRILQEKFNTSNSNIISDSSILLINANVKVITFD